MAIIILHFTILQCYIALIGMKQKPDPGDAGFRGLKYDQLFGITFPLICKTTG